MRKYLEWFIITLAVVATLIVSAAAGTYFIFEYFLPFLSEYF